jgi:hypothetical protein
MNDSLSGGPFGLYTTIYFWIMVLMYWLLTFLHARSSLIWPFVVALGVLFQNFVIITIFTLSGRSFGVSGFPFIMLITQFVLALFTGPLVLRFYSWSTSASIRLLRSVTPRKEV